MVAAKATDQAPERRCSVFSMGLDNIVVVDEAAAQGENFGWQTSQTIRCTDAPQKSTTPEAKISTTSKTARTTLAMADSPLRNRTSMVTSVATGEVGNKYEVQSVLGEGGFGKVEKVVSKESKLTYACKTIPFENLRQKFTFEDELSVAGQLKHPNIVRVQEALKGENQYFLIMDCCTGGDLEAVIELNGKQKIHTAADACARFWWQMLAGCSYMHHHMLCHRDIKPGNYMLQTPEENSPLKLIDFGIATIFSSDQPLTDKVGTLCYMSPEVIKGSYDERCDVWSIGVTMYYLLCNDLPFLARSQDITKLQIQELELPFAGKIWDSIPNDAKALLKFMLCKDYKNRTTAQNIIETNEYLLPFAEEIASYRNDQSTVQATTQPIELTIEAEKGTTEAQPIEAKKGGCCSVL